MSYNFLIYNVYYRLLVNLVSMAKFNPVGVGVAAVPWVIGGVAVYEGYLVVTDTPPFIGPDPINGILKDVKGIILGLLGGGGNGGTCTKTCTAPKVLDLEECECVDPQNCTKTCTAPQVIDEETCTCVTPAPGCTKTCTSPQVLDAATCTCKTPPTPPPPTTGCFGRALSHYSSGMQKALCEKWCGGTRCSRYCFCKDCTTGPCK